VLYAILLQKVRRHEAGEILPLLKCQCNSVMLPVYQLMCKRPIYHPRLVDVGCIIFELIELLVLMHISAEGFCVELLVPLLRGVESPAEGHAMTDMTRVAVEDLFHLVRLAWPNREEDKLVEAR